MVWADFHNRNLFVQTLLLAIGGGASLVFSDFPVASSGDSTGLKSHIFGVLLVGVAETTILVSKGLALSIGVPVIMGLIMSVILIEGIIQVTIDPGQLGDIPEVERHLGQFSWLVVVSLSNWVQVLV